MVLRAVNYQVHRSCPQDSMSASDCGRLDPAARVSRSERRRLSAMLSVPALLSAIVVLVAFNRSGDGVVRAERVDLVDPKGALHAAVGADTAGLTLVVYDTLGRVTASLRLTDEAGLVIRDASGREVAWLGVPRVRHLAE